MRQSARAWLGRVAQVFHSPDTAVSQLALGQALLVTCGLIVASTIWSLDPTPLTTPVLSAVSVLLLGIVGLTPRLPWSEEPSRLPLVFPVCVLAGLTSVGFADAGSATAYTGLIVLCFVYVGLTQQPGTSLWLTPLAAATWLVLQNSSWSAIIAVRLVIAIFLWLVVGELLAFRSDRAARDRITLARHAHTDSLTGLINRRALDARLASSVTGDTVVMCDLDHFKALNDREGHAAGDLVLAEFGGLLRASLRGEDAAGRYGGEEFVLLLADTSPEAALDVLARMRSRWDSMHPEITFSTGIAAISDTSPIGIALAAADEALYASKAAGRNCDHINYQHIVKAN